MKIKSLFSKKHFFIFYYCFLFCFLIPFCGFAQSNRYQFTHDLILKPYDGAALLAGVSTLEAIRLPARTKFVVVIPENQTNLGKDSVIQLLDPVCWRSIPKVGTEDASKFYFRLSPEQFNSYVEPGIRKWQITTGIVNLPVRIRLGGSSKSYIRTIDGKEVKVEARPELDFSTSLNLGLAAGIRRLMDGGDSYGFIAGFNMGTQKVNAKSTGSYIQDEQEAALFNPFLGIFYGIKSIQFGGMLGWDFIGGELGRNWVYQKRPWIGVGISASFFTAETKPAKN